MPARERPGDRGRGLIRRDLREVLADLRARRLALGISQAAVGDAIGVSRAMVGKLERGEVEAPDLADLGAMSAVLGLRLRVSSYPHGQPVADAVQLRLLEAFRARLPPSATVRTEVPLPIEGDLRAWDCVVVNGREWTGTEAVSRLGMIDATIRRILQKQRDDPRIAAVVLLVADTTRNRESIRAAGRSLRDAFPLDGTAVLRELAAGRSPHRNGVLLQRVPAPPAVR